MKMNQKGFTLIEILMVVLLVAIMALVAIPQFIDFQTDAKNAATNGALGSLRGAIANQKAQMIMRCEEPGAIWPTVLMVNGNDVTAGAGAVIDTVDGLCFDDPAEVDATNTGDELFLSGGIPVNPWGANATVLVGDSTTRATCNLGCDGASAVAGGWCYDPAAGVIWADSTSNGSALIGDRECSF